MKSVMSHQFSQVPSAEIPRSRFDRSHGYKTTFDSGYLIPVFIDEALPGDTFSLRMSQFTRMATPIVPVMDNMFLDTFFFSVPVRLLWNNWQKFNGEQEDPGDSTDYIVPQMSSGTLDKYDIGSIHDYFGLPVDKVKVTHSALWHRAYNLIWNEWFRDQNLQDSVPVNKGDGPDDPTDYKLLRRGKRHDYFTSALPWPQKGPAVELPLGGTAPMVPTVPNTEFILGPAHGSMMPDWPAAKSSHDRQGDNDGSSGNKMLYVTNTTGISPAETTLVVRNLGLEADLSEATSATINAIRQAFQIQKLYERDARGGTRYTEIIKSHFGVTSDDARLQRPEYLGGGSAPINVHPVEQTSSSDSTSPQGNLAAFGTSTSNGHGFSKSFTEHSILIGLVSVRADLTYQQGLNRMFSRKTRWDYYWPGLSHLGEQAVLNKEIYYSGDNMYDDDVFGYQERYAEYRYKPSLITGKFRSITPQSLDIWHLSQDFETPPVLNSEFIEERPPIDRIVAVPTEPQFLFDSYFQLQCARPMPIYSVPGLVDHF